MSKIAFRPANSRGPLARFATHRPRRFAARFLLVASCVAALTGCVTLVEFDTEKHLLAFREADRSVVMVLVPDALANERVDTNGVEDNVEGESVPIRWPHAFEAQLARNVLGGWHSLDPDLRLQASAPGDEYLALRDLDDCLAEQDRIETPWHEMESLSGLRYLDEPMRPIAAQKGLPRRVAPDSVTLLTPTPTGNDARTVCHTLDLRRVRRNFDVNYAFVVEVAAIRVRAEDGRLRTRVTLHERLIALSDGMIVREHRRELVDNDPSGLLGTSLLGLNGVDATAQERLFDALETVSRRLPWLLAREYGDIDAAALASQEAQWAGAFAAQIERLREAIAVTR
ncbi:MAG: hypothetical protein KJ042_13245 [Deltaproteobacteria bacterium]|nr:hypothetical protein [Deltaproteobacteria bacterium]